ncbi:hypothetical protein JWG42_08655 [Desulfoprunum benzoelyticum]|uniref:Uncharacterized protein n=1 Tax=Desulfoprunum benzoelyticum TaxID=1506996 RepID=A0A840US16_9BACT|nr:hypothetical protein [Desulfoprunum benzoelyticum]MBB5348445.1 hypothetical protein [Desulfoprunum benzoelyticum]MBM9530219.1 hypothetical protein [Desulfoprunum benzoelyticum]
MIQIIDHVGERYLCPVTQKTETVLIQQITTKPKVVEIRKEHIYPIAKNFEYCSGLDVCGVMTIHGDGLTFSWELCPLKASL